MIHYFSVSAQPENPCVICLEPLDDSQAVVAHTHPESSWMNLIFKSWETSPSAPWHAVHTSCLSPWLKLDASCPMCKAKCHPWMTSKTELLKSTMRIAIPIISGAGSIILIHNYIHDGIVAEQQQAMNDLISRHNIPRETLLPYLKQAIASQTTDVLFRCYNSLFLSLPPILISINWLARRIFDMDWIIPSRMETTGWVVIGIVIGSSWVEDFQASIITANVAKMAGFLWNSVF